METQTHGLLAWTASIRTAMVNDPGRQLFEDQIQTQGFLFLDEYLDNILAESKKEYAGSTSLDCLTSDLL